MNKPYLENRSSNQGIPFDGKHYNFDGTCFSFTRATEEVGLAFSVLGDAVSEIKIIGGGGLTFVTEAMILQYAEMKLKKDTKLKVMNPCSNGVMWALCSGAEVVGSCMTHGPSMRDLNNHAYALIDYVQFQRPFIESCVEREIMVSEHAKLYMSNYSQFLQLSGSYPNVNLADAWFKVLPEINLLHVEATLAMLAGVKPVTSHA